VAIRVDFEPGSGPSVLFAILQRRPRVCEHKRDRLDCLAEPCGQSSARIPPQVLLVCVRDFKVRHPCNLFNLIQLDGEAFHREAVL
jgi:hypothetical protein